MPSRTELARRGGVVRVRTRKIGARRYQHIYVVAEPGPRGGRTIAGEVKRDKSPRYEMRPAKRKKVRRGTT